MPHSYRPKPKSKIVKAAVKAERTSRALGSFATWGCPGCRETVPVAKFFCPGCWLELPAGHQSVVLDAFTAGRIAAFLTAVERAQGWLWRSRGGAPPFDVLELDLSGLDVVDGAAAWS